MEPDARSPAPATRRRYERVILTECPADVFRLRALSFLNSRTSIGRKLINLSEVGVQVSVTERLELGARIRLSAKIPKVGDIIEGELVVRWCATNLHVAGEFFVGAEFTTMPPGQMARIQQLRKLLRSAQFKLKQTTIRREEREANAGDALKIVENPHTKP